MMKGKAAQITIARALLASIVDRKESIIFPFSSVQQEKLAFPLPTKEQGEAWQAIRCIPALLVVYV
jgi:hypothetical protein